MSEPAQRPVLARIIAAHEGRGPGRPDPSPHLQTAMARTIRRAAMPFEGFTPKVGDVAVKRDIDLSEVEAELPEHGLIAALEDDGGRRGMVMLEHTLLDALIEVQTTGKVEDITLPPRRVTAIDEALCRDFLGLILAAFAKEAGEAPGRDWPLRMTYGSKIGDLRQLNLLFPARGYHCLKAEVSVGESRTGSIGLILPVDPVLARQAAARARERDKPKPRARPQDWPDKVLKALGGAPMALDAVLTRMVVPLGEVQDLDIGHVLPFDPEDLGMVTLEDSDDRILARGSLGQLRGRRALRMAPGAGQGAAPTAIAQSTGAAPMLPSSADPNGAMGGDVSAGDPKALMAEPAGAGLPDMSAQGGLPDLPLANFDPNAPMG
ncbi:FliM/FliN family flagellar motor switch protein [Gymnodinialimonas sp. 2305UL16-5]|uniref:FliM/FliN family flagellar motor switch protein n=1 Tax=Gymnodinialimonas mytili TaxID=3126503 RepID=UPI003094FD5A